MLRGFEILPRSVARDLSFFGAVLACSSRNERVFLRPTSRVGGGLSGGGALASRKGTVFAHCRGAATPRSLLLSPAVLEGELGGTRSFVPLAFIRGASPRRAFFSLSIPPDGPYGRRVGLGIGNGQRGRFVGD